MSYEMISIRRLIASLLAGALLVLATAAQASAQPAADLDRAFEGVALGLAAASVVEGDVIVVDESLIEALDVYEAWAAKHEDSNRQGDGQGPINAQAVHERLLEREVPGQLKKDSGSKLSALSGMYEVLKGNSEEAKAAKDAKEKSNNGKSDDKKSKDEKSNNGKSDDKSSSEASRGQQNKP